MLIPTAQLHPWEKNPKTLSKDGYARLEKQIRLGQHSTLLVMPDGTVIGGNSRVRLYKEKGIEMADCKILTFVTTEGGFVPAIDGVIVIDFETGLPVTFDTIEAGMLAYALSHNDEVGIYSDDLINILGDHNLDWEMFGALTKEKVSIADWADAVAPGSLTDEFLASDELLSDSLKEDEKDKPTEVEKFEERLVKCPDCAAIFDPKKHAVKS